MRPIVRVYELILGQAPLPHFSLQRLGHLRVVGQEVEEARHVVDVLLPNSLTRLVITIRIVPTAADVIGRERAVVVHIEFPMLPQLVWLHHVYQRQRASGHALGLFQKTRQQFITRRVVARRFRKRGLIVRVIGQAHAEVVGLDFLVCLARLAFIAAVNSGQQLAVLITRLDLHGQPFALRVFQVFADEELMLRRPVAHAGERFTVLGGAFAAPCVRHVRLRHEIAFVAAIGKDLGLKTRAVLHGDLGHLRAAFLDATLFAYPVIEEHGDACLLAPVFEDLFGDVRLERPRHRLAVMLTNTPEEFK